MPADPGVELRMSAKLTREAQKSGPGPTAARPATVTTEPTEVASRLGLTGPSDSRRRGALLRRLLATGDWVAIFAALCVATAVTSTTDVPKLFWAVLFTPAWILVLKLHGLYDNDHRRIRHSTFDELPSLVSASALGTIVLDGLLALSPVGPLSAKSAIMVGIGALLACFVARAVLRFAWHHLTGVATGIVVGPAAMADVVVRRIATHPEARLRLVGYLSAPHDKDRRASLPRLGLTFLPKHYGLLGLGIELNRLAELPVLDFRFSDPPRSTLAMKRALDIGVSGAMLAVLSPLLAAIALLIVIDSGMPVFFRQRRAGKDGVPFTMLKFRTMVADAEQQLAELVDLEKLDEPAFKIPDDPRITRAGRFLRRTSLDELPQLINVLRGDMSLVGPRPEEEAV